MNKLRRLLVLVRWLRVCLARPGLVNSVREAQAKWSRFMDNPFWDDATPGSWGPGNAPDANDFEAELRHKKAGPTS